MFSYCRTAALVLLAVSATVGAQAQSSSSSQEPAQQPAATEPSKPALSGAASVQARVRARRAQRRAAAIHDVYDHGYEVYFGGGYLRFTPGPGAAGSTGGLQRVNEYLWDVGVTRYFTQNLGVTVDGRGNFGTAYLGNNQYSLVKPKISEYMGMVGPTYRFIKDPKFSVSGRVLVGGAFGNFLSDANGYTAAETGLYPDGGGLAVSAGLPVEYNVSPALGVRVTPEYVMTNFGSTIQNNLGFTAGVVIRFGKR